MQVTSCYAPSSPRFWGGRMVQEPGTAFNAGDSVTDVDQRALAIITFVLGGAALLSRVMAVVTRGSLVAVLLTSWGLFVLSCILFLMSLRQGGKRR